MKLNAHAPEGFTLIEVLVTTAVFGLAIATVYAILEAGRRTVVSHAEAQELQQRLRVGVDGLQRALSAAGAGLAAGPVAGPLHRYTAPVRPYRIGDRGDDRATGVHFRGDRLSVLAVQRGAAVLRVQSIQRAGGRASVAVTASCNLASCGPEAGDLVAVFDGAGYVCSGSVVGRDGATFAVEGPRMEACEVDVASGAVLAHVDLASFALARDAANGGQRLMRYDGQRSELPLIDAVVSLTFEYDGDPNPPVVVAGLDGSLHTTYGPRPPPVGLDDPRDDWPAGENCTFADAGGVHTPRLPRLAAAAPLVTLPAALLTDGPWCPDADASDRFDADLLRIRRVRVRLRARATMMALTGIAMARNPGAIWPWSAGDQELRIQITPRNLAATAP